MSSTAVCADCNAVVGFDAASCGDCGRVFPKAPPRRKPVDQEFYAHNYATMGIIAMVVMGFTMVFWRDQVTVVDTSFVGIVFAGTFLPMLVARLGLIHTPRAAWVGFALTLAVVAGYRIHTVSKAVDELHASQAAVAEFDDALRQLRERHRLFLMRDETGESLAAGKPAEVRAATSANDMHALLAAVLRANSDRTMQLHTAWQREMDKIKEVVRPQRMVTAKGLGELRATLDVYRAANAKLAEDEQAMRLDLLKQVDTIIGDRPERDAVLERIRSDMTLRGAQIARIAAHNETVGNVAEETFAFMRKRLGHVQFANNALIFDDLVQLQAFRKFGDRFQNLEDEELEMRMQMVAALGRYR
ncbi:hypothetical protein LF41_1121 [Lysobacter dokdonensis DS-58]|uniref:Transmembrane protein n=1 Tax=Lysobacter dokdonensis DS-58 TaxID=1300345 RepID=A0A0A2X5S4_9GAMM|nr:hypothetical protein [Lysobacter dokdonensis]KGQ20584.1 hypothetical protein LF41_1121 [Lysobacter dokdonensis DS-58]